MVVAGVEPPRDVDQGVPSPSFSLEVGRGCAGAAARTARGFGLGGGVVFAGSLVSPGDSLVFVVSVAGAVAEAAGGDDDVAATAEVDADADDGALEAGVSDGAVTGGSGVRRAVDDDDDGVRGAVDAGAAATSTFEPRPRKVHALATIATAAIETTAPATRDFRLRGGR